jgi:hypothetical protein
VPRPACEELALEQVRRVQRGVRRLVDGLMSQLQMLEALAGAPEADRERLAEGMGRARSTLLEDYWQVERQSAELGRLYAASCRLHSAADPDDIVELIRDVAGDLLGCSRMALYAVDQGGLTLIAAWGAAPDLPARPPLGPGPLGRSAELGQPWLLDGPPSPVYLGGSPLHAAIPLRSRGRVRAVLALLEKPAPLVDPEHAFELLGTHGGAALHGVRLSRHERALVAV